MTYNLIRREYYLSTWLERKVDSITFQDKESALKALEKQEARYDRGMKYVNEDKESLVPVKDRETIIKVKKPETPNTFESITYAYKKDKKPIIMLTLEEEE